MSGEPTTTSAAAQVTELGVSRPVDLDEVVHVDGHGLTLPVRPPAGRGSG